MEKKYIENSKEKLLKIKAALKKERLLRIKASLKNEKSLSSANGFAAAGSIVMLPFAVFDSFSYGTISGIFVTSFVVMCASSNSIFFYKSQKVINKLNQKIVDLENSKSKYNNQKKLTKKANH